MTDLNIAFGILFLRHWNENKSKNSNACFGHSFWLSIHHIYITLSNVNIFVTLFNTRKLPLHNRIKSKRKIRCGTEVNIRKNKIFNHLQHKRTWSSIIANNETNIANFFEENLRFSTENKRRFLTYNLLLFQYLENYYNSKYNLFFDKNFTYFRK